jgi:hypothetical protein
MGQPPDDKLPSNRGQAFKLDFGKNAFRVDEKAGMADPLVQKLPPEPGAVPPAKSVPWAQILNAPKDKKK